jgi:hypothetical protein
MIRSYEGFDSRAYERRQIGTSINGNLRLTPGDIHAVDRVVQSPLAASNSFSSLLKVLEAVTRV